MSRSVRQDYERYRKDPVGLTLVEAIHRRKEQKGRAMASDDFFLTTEEQELIARALKFYSEHPEYMSEAELETLDTVVTLARDFGSTLDVMKCAICGSEVYWAPTTLEWVHRDKNGCPEN